MDEEGQEAAVVVVVAGVSDQMDQYRLLPELDMK